MALAVARKGNAGRCGTGLGRLQFRGTLSVLEGRAGCDVQGPGDSSCGWSQVVIRVDAESTWLALCVCGGRRAGGVPVGWVVNWEVQSGCGGGPSRAVPGPGHTAPRRAS